MAVLVSLGPGCASLLLTQLESDNLQVNENENENGNLDSSSTRKGIYQMDEAAGAHKLVDGYWRMGPG